MDAKLSRFMFERQNSEIFLGCFSMWHPQPVATLLDK